MTPSQARPTHRIQSQFERVARLVRHIEAGCTQAGQDDVSNVLVRHRPALFGAMHVLGDTIADFLASNPSPNAIQSSRERIIPSIRAWSATGPFFQHAFYKRRGYTGDFETIEIIYDCRPTGDDLLGLIFDDYYLHARPAQAVRNRLTYLVQRLQTEVQQLARANRTPMRLLSLGSGPARELALLAAEPGFCERVQATCLDLDPGALAHARQRLAHLDGRIAYVRANALRFAHSPDRPIEPYHLIYAAGLFDYLNADQSAQLIEDCHSLLAPGGLLLIGNFSQETHLSDRVLMDWLLEWRLIHRSEDDFRAIFARTSFGVERVHFEYEPLCANLFIVTQRD